MQVAVLQEFSSRKQSDGTRRDGRDAPAPLQETMEMVAWMWQVLLFVPRVLSCAVALKCVGNIHLTMCVVGRFSEHMKTLFVCHLLKQHIEFVI